jgi:hypothetical protein
MVQGWVGSLGKGEVQILTHLLMLMVIYRVVVQTQHSHFRAFRENSKSRKHEIEVTWYQNYLSIE